MKKLMCAIGAAAIAGIAMADVSSANIVGYNQVFIKGGKMNLLTCSFESVGNPNGEACLNDVMDMSKLIPFDWDDFVERDYVDTWDMEAGNWGPTYFVDVGEAGNIFVDSSSLEPADAMVKSGASLWLFRYGDDIDGFTFAGQVGTGVKSYTLTAGKMNLCGNPYPTALNLNDPNQVTITGATEFDWDDFVEKDYIDTWDLTTSNWGPSYFYVDGAWADSGSLEKLDNAEIQPGAGFWYFAYGEGVTLTFNGIN